MSDPSPIGMMPPPSEPGPDESSPDMEASAPGKAPLPLFDPPHADSTASTSAPRDPAVVTSLMAIFYPNGECPLQLTRAVRPVVNCDRFSMPAPPSPPTVHEEDDELGELPPLDGDLRDAPQPETDADDEAPPQGEASLDDSTGEDEPTDDEEIDLDESDGGWLDEPADAPGLDLGDTATIDLGTEVAAEDDADEPAMPPEDLGFGTSPERLVLDAGDEGPVDPDEELRDEDLPALDADEAGDVDEALLMDASFASDEPHGLPWATGPWERVGAPLPLVRAVAVACSGRGAVVVGCGEAGAAGAAGEATGGKAELWRIDLEGASQALPARGLDVAAVRGLEGHAQAVSARLDSGQRFVSTDGGVTFLAQPAAATPEAPAAPREALAPFPHAERASHETYAARDGGVVRRLAGGDAITYSWGGRVTALVFLDDAGRLLAATYSDADDTTALVHLDVAGVASVVARIGATRADPDSDGQVFSMAHDEARGVVWLAGGFGVAAFAVR
jgi:hypothetical protein